MTQALQASTWRKPAEIRKALLSQGPLAPQWLQKSDRYGWWITLRILVPFFGLIAAAPWLWMMVSPWTVLPVALLLGVYGYKISFIMHDCSHDTLFVAREMNDKVGDFCGWIVGSEYRKFKRVHILHHRHNGAHEDPQYEDYCGLKEVTKRGLVWHLTNALMFWRVPGYLKTYLGHGGEPGDHGYVPPVAGEGFSWRWAAKVVVMQVACVVLVTGFGQVPGLILLYPITAMTLSLFFARLRTVAEHIEPPEGEYEDFVRTHKPTLVDSFFLYDSHFNYHMEHHLFPQMPAKNLPEFHAQYKEVIHTDKMTLCPSMIKTLIARIGAAR